MPDKATVEDLSQETVARILRVSPRLSEEALFGYAIVTAQNLVISQRRSDARTAQTRPSTIDLTRPEEPEEAVLRQEIERAVLRALDRLPQEERDLIVDHELHGFDTATLAEQTGSTPGGVATRLARIRAKLRVEFVLAYRDVTPATEKCRPVLVSLTAGDIRRQRRLDAGDHLLHCPTCRSVSEPLLKRKASLAGFLPFPFLLGKVAAWIKASPAKAALAGVFIVGGGAVATHAVLTTPPHHPTASVRPASNIVLMSGRPLVVTPDGDGLASHTGDRVRVRSARVLGVPADEGFWISAGAKSDAALWTHLDVKGESPKHVEKNDTVSFVAKIVRGAPAGSRGSVDQVHLTATRIATDRHAK